MFCLPSLIPSLNPHAPPPTLILLKVPSKIITLSFTPLTVCHVNGLPFTVQFLVFWIPILVILYFIIYIITLVIIKHIL